MKRIFFLRRQIAQREIALSMVDPANTEIVLTKEHNLKDHRILEGHFLSPAKRLMEGILPVECEKAYFQVVLPPEEGQEDRGGKEKAFRGYKPMCIQVGRGLVVK